MFSLESLGALAAHFANLVDDVHGHRPPSQFFLEHVPARTVAGSVVAQQQQPRRLRTLPASLLDRLGVATRQAGDVLDAAVPKFGRLDGRVACRSFSDGH